MTGSSELNHSESLNSGAIQAQESLESFPRELKVVSLYLALTAQRSSFNLVVNDVYLFMKDRYFVGEVLQACLEGKSWSNCTILQVCEPSEQEVEDYNKLVIVNPTEEHHLFPPACLYKYRVQKFCSYNDINHVFEASASHVRRKKRQITKGKLRQFLKSCLVLDSRGIWVVQEHIVQNFCIHSLKFSDIFVGCPPKFPARYERIAKKVKKNSPKNLLDQPIRSGGKKIKLEPSKSPRRDKNSSMSSNEDMSDFKNVIVNNRSTEAHNSVIPCRVIVRKLSNSDGNRKIVKKVKKKFVKPEGEKENVNQGTRRKNSTWRGLTVEERQKLKEKKAKRALLDKLKKKEERLKLKEKLKEEKLKIALMLKDHNRLREDLECEDLKPLPIPHTVNCSSIPNELFGDFIFVVEFFHCFKTVVKTKQIFPRGIKCEFLEQALTENNMDGMLTKITVFLLKELYEMQGEDNEVIDCDTTPDLNDELGDISTSEAIRLAAAEYSGQLYNGAFANTMNLNHLTVTEVLRLHFISCGGRRWNPNRNRKASVDPGDPVTVLCTQLPHLMDKLCDVHLCELSIKEKISILNCLVDEILACPPLRGELEKRGEELKQRKIELRTLKAAEVKKGKEAAQRIKEKKEAGLKLKQQDNAVLMPEPEDLNTENLVFEKELRSSAKKMDFKEMYIQLRSLAMNFHLCPIGLDRAHRRFWVFSSVPGLFVEQKPFEIGPCLLQPTPREPLSPRSDGKSRKNSPQKSPKKEAEAASRSSCLTNNVETIHTESWVCSSSADCRVHGRAVADSKWSYFRREEEITLLLENLNKRGLRENELRKILQKDEQWVKECVSMCPLSFIDPSLVPEISQEQSSRTSNVQDNSEDVGSIFEIILRDRILDLENKIASGCLGCLEVEDIKEWREAVENGEYNMQCSQLSWGMYTDPKQKDGTESCESVKKDISSFSSLLSGVEVRNGEFVITQKSLQVLLDGQSVSNEFNGESNSSFSCEKSGQVCRTSPRKFVEAMVIDSEDVDKNRTKKICAVRGLSCAILQLEQSLDLKYFKKPLVEENDSEDDKIYQLKQWETSLMTASSVSQLFLHLQILDSSILWSKSVTNTQCVTCRRRSDAEKMLLCDGCNRGTHIFCLRPKLTKIPEGDWFCPKCEPEFKKDHPEKKRKSANGVVENKDSERRPSKSRRMTHNDVCEACGLRYNLILCSSCPLAFHLECVDPPLKELPEGLWACRECDSEGVVVPEEKENEIASSRRTSRRKSGPNDLLLNNSVLQDLLSDLMCHRDSWPFLQPVRKGDAPRYHIIIKKPMDFGTMKYKLNRSHYKNNSEFIDDALLVFANCRMYNENEGEVYKCGARLSEYFKKRCRDLGFQCRD